MNDCWWLVVRVYEKCPAIIRNHNGNGYVKCNTLIAISFLYTMLTDTPRTLYTMSCPSRMVQHNRGISIHCNEHTDNIDGHDTKHSKNYEVLQFCGHKIVWFNDDNVSAE